MKASDKATISLLVGVFLCVSVRADILLESSFDFEAQTVVYAYADLADVRTDTLFEPPVNAADQPVCTYSAPEALHSNSVNFNGYTRIPDLMPEHMPFLMDAEMDATRPSCGHSVHVLAEGQSSLSLCVSALMSLGLCTSIRGAKKLSLGSPPKWYHTGGPFQIGHSMAVDLESVCPVPVCRFVQPAQVVADIALQRHVGTVVSLWRTSQFTPDSIASRGPPILS